MSRQLNSSYGRACVRRLSEYFTVLAALLLAVVAPHTYAQNACNISYTISPQNTSAFGAAITIQNTGTTAWTSWTLTWAFANGQTVSELWNGVEAQSAANVTVTNEPYNGSVAVGGSVSGIGFNGTWNGVTNAAPTSFAVNGTTCGGAATGGFKLASSTSTLSIALGASGTDTITVTDISPFTGSVSFAASGQPTGVTASFSPASSAGSSVVTFAVAATTAAGTYPITITGTSGALTPATATISLTVPPASGFTLTPSASALSIVQGASGTDTITVRDTGTFTGSVTLAASGMPAGVTATFGTNPTAATSVLTLAVATTAVAGTYPITITGTSGTLSPVTISISFTVTGLGSFSLSASPASLTVAPGGSGTDTIAVTDVSPFAGSVTFAASGMPTGVTATFSPASSTTSGVVTLAVAATTVTGTYPITITGTSGTLSTTTSISLIVGTTTGACQVVYTISPQSTTAFGAALTIENTGTTALTSWTLTWTFANGQTISSLWNGIETQSGANVTVTNESYNSSIPAGGSLTGIGFNGNWNGISNAVPTSFAINGTTCGSSGGGGSFKLAPSASTLTIAQGASGTDTITVTDVSPFTGGVTFAASGMPAGVTASFSPASSTGSSVVTFAVASTTVAGSYPITITGTSGTLTPVTTSITLTVTGVGSFTLAVPVSPPVSIPQCGTAAVPVTVTDVGGFGGSVTIAASGIPSGVAFALSPNPITSGTVTITITVSCSAPVGTYTTTLTGTSGALTETTTFPITITAATPNYTLSVSPATLTIAPGSTGTSTIAVTDEGGFTGSVTLAASGLPTGVTITIATNPAAATSVLSFTAAATAVNGTSTVTITGTSGTLTPVTTTISLTVGTGLAETFKGYFLDMYGDMTQANGYFSPLGIPYHSVETMIIEAPDYGHETVSETYSYYLWLESMYGAVTGTWTPLQTAWDSYQTYMIPSAAEQPTNAGYNPSSPATYAPTWDSPSNYPSTLTTSVPVGIDPIATELSTTYGTPNIYGAHWIMDTSDWYGYGINENGSGTPSCINTYQRGPQESVWLTVPQPCWDNFVYGNTSDGGYLSLFTSGPYTQQWKYTDAPDADARAIQAMYWAQQYSNGNSTVASLLPLASELGDYLRYSFFDKYFKEQGCQSLACPVENGTKNSSAYLLSWYYAWGGAIPADGSWAWRIGSSDIHFGYQNPLAAYALSTDAALIPKSPTAKADWTTGLERQIEFYRWLQSSNGAIAGGATNSWGGGSNANETAWGGQYAVPPAGTSTFYGLSYIAEPSYDNPPSNSWFGFQAWSMERVAEYYYVTGNADAKIILDPWIAWVEANTTTNGTSYAIPSNLIWSGQPALNWNATTQNWTPGTAFNAGLTVTITSTSQDVGVTGSLSKALLYYSAGTAKWAGAQDMPSFTLAQTLLKDVWADDRDSIGVSAAETGTTYNQITMPIYIPPGWTGTMPNGDPINSDSTFLSIRTQYENDPEYLVVAAYAAGTGPAPVFKFHRFWAQTDVATAYAVYYLLFPND